MDKQQIDWIKEDLLDALANVNGVDMRERYRERMERLCFAARTPTDYNALRQVIHAAGIGSRGSAGENYITAPVPEWGLVFKFDGSGKLVEVVR